LDKVFTTKDYIKGTGGARCKRTNPPRSQKTKKEREHEKGGKSEGEEPPTVLSRGPYKRSWGCREGGTSKGSIGGGGEKSRKTLFGSKKSTELNLPESLDLKELAGDQKLKYRDTTDFEGGLRGSLSWKKTLSCKKRPENGQAGRVDGIRKGSKKKKSVAVNLNCQRVCFNSYARKKKWKNKKRGKSEKEKANSGKGASSQGKNSGPQEASTAKKKGAGGGGGSWGG